MHGPGPERGRKSSPRGVHGHAMLRQRRKGAQGNGHVYPRRRREGAVVCGLLGKELFELPSSSAGYTEINHPGL